MLSDFGGSFLHEPAEVHQIHELDQLRTMRSGKDQAAARHALGMIQTTWGGFAGFAKAYEQQKAGAAPEKNGGSQAANCFIRLFEVMREDR